MSNADDRNRPTEQITFRAPLAVAAELERLADQAKAAHPMYSISRSDVLREIVALGLAALAARGATGG